MDDRSERSGSGRDGGVVPAPGQQVCYPVGRMIGQPGEDVGEPGLRVDVTEICRLDQGVDRGRAAAAVIGAGGGAVLAPDGDLAPKFYPDLSSFGRLDVSTRAAEAGAEPSAYRSARSRRGLQVAANSDGVFQPSWECGRASL